MERPSSNTWRKCTTCKRPIYFGQNYWICSVSTCNRARTDLVFCDLRCFDAHVPVMNHRDAGAFEKRAPTIAPRAPEEKEALTPPELQEEAGTLDILVVVSKVKEYIRVKAGMNTSDAVMKKLSDRVRGFANAVIENAKKTGRKTVMKYDI